MAVGDYPELRRHNPLPHLLVVTHDLVVAGEMLWEWSELRPEAPEPYGAIWEQQSALALSAVRFIRYGKAE